MAKARTYNTCVWSDHEMVAEIRSKALKMGAHSVATRVVSPNQVETAIAFKKKNNMQEFTAWVKRKRHGIELCEV